MTHGAPLCRARRVCLAALVVVQAVGLWTLFSSRPAPAPLRRVSDLSPRALLHDTLYGEDSQLHRCVGIGISGLVDEAASGKMFFSDMHAVLVGIKNRGAPSAVEQWRELAEDVEPAETLEAAGPTASWNVSELEFFEAIERFAGRDPSEVSLAQGDVVVSLRDVQAASTGWRYGEVAGRVGYYPVTFVRPLEMSPGSSAAEECMLSRDVGAREVSELSALRGSVVRVLSRTHEASRGQVLALSARGWGTLPSKALAYCRTAGGAWQRAVSAFREHWVTLRLDVLALSPTTEVFFSTIGHAGLPLHLTLLFEQQLVLVSTRGMYKSWNEVRALHLNATHSRLPLSGAFDLSLVIGPREFRVLLDGRHVLTWPHSIDVDDEVEKLTVAGGCRVLRAVASWSRRAGGNLMPDLIDMLEAVRPHARSLAPPLPNQTVVFPNPPLRDDATLDAELEAMAAGCDKASGQPASAGRVSGRQRSYAVMVGILSSVRNVAERQAVRLSWMRSDALQKQRVLARFFVGTVPDEAAMEAVRREAALYGDMVITREADTYDNLSYKTIAICRYGAREVVADFVLKVDDDTAVRVDQVLERLKHSEPSQERGVLMGLISFDARPHRVKGSKWFMSPDDFAPEVYPYFPHGPGYVLSRNLADAVVRAVDEGKVKVLRLEDVSMGIWLEYVNRTSLRVSYEHDSRFNALACHPHMATGHYTSPAMQLSIWWRDLNRERNVCM